MPDLYPFFPGIFAPRTDLQDQAPKRGVESTGAFGRGERFDLRPRGPTERLPAVLRPGLNANCKSRLKKTDIAIARSTVKERKKITRTTNARAGVIRLLCCVFSSANVCRNQWNEDGSSPSY